MKTIKDAMASELGHLRFDKAFAKEIITYTQRFVSKSPEHVEFFGNGLLGTPKARFTTHDSLVWFEEVLDCDEASLAEKLHSLTKIEDGKEVPLLVRTHNVETNIFNLTITYVVHGLMTSKRVDDKYRQRAMEAALNMLQYKFLTSLMASHYFHGANPEVALAAYTALNRRFSLKVQGSWIGLIESRSQDVLSDTSIHINTLKKYDIAKGIFYVLSDMQTRIRDVVVTYNKVFYNVHDNDKRIATRTALISVEGDTKLLDSVNSQGQMLTAILESANEHASFVKSELKEVVEDTVHTMPRRAFDESLTFITDNYGKRRAEYIRELIENTIVHLFETIDGEYRLNDLAAIITKMRSLYTAPLAKGKHIQEIRDLAERVVKEAKVSTNATSIAATRTGLLLYIILRALTHSKYT